VTRAVSLLLADYPEEEFTAGGTPYTLSLGALSAALSSDSPEPPERGNQWIRLNQGSQVQANFPAGARLLMFPNASRVTISFSQPVNSIGLALGNSDYGREVFYCTFWRYGVPVGSVTVSGVSGSDALRAPAPRLDYTAPSGQAFTTCVIVKAAEPPQFGVLIGPMAVQPGQAQ
jgi:hypothetical protein